jgi:hypothetical protein
LAILERTARIPVFRLLPWASIVVVWILVFSASPIRTAPLSGGAYFQDDFENGLGQWSMEGGSSQFGLGTGFTGQAATLTTLSNSAGPNASSQMASLYLNPGASVRASDGNDTWYHVKLYLPSDYHATTGEWNWLVEWHDDLTTYNECNSCSSIALGVYTDYPVTTGYGQNPRLALRLMGGPTSAPVTKTVTLPTNSLQLGHWYDLTFHFVWSSSATAGQAQWWVDGQQYLSTAFPTLYRRNDGSASINGFGLYNYHLSSSWASTVSFDHVLIGPTQASVN